MSTNKRAFNTVEPGFLYELPIYKIVEGKGIEETGEVLHLHFVRGSKLCDENQNTPKDGTLHEHVLSAMIEDLKFKNKEVPSRETAIVITKLEEARLWMEERQRSRDAAGVIGTYKPVKGGL